jgi:hypothetical protein
MQTSLFEKGNSNLLPDQGEAFFYPALFSKTESEAYMDNL